MSATTRSATPNDIPILIEMMRQFYAEADYTLDSDWANAAFRGLLSDDAYGKAWVAHVDEEPAGYVVLTLHYSMEHGGLAASMDDLFVLPAYRQSGVGRNLLQELFGYCSQRNVVAVHVEVGPDNTAAKKLYNSFGLQPRNDTREVLVKRCR